MRAVPLLLTIAMALAAPAIHSDDKAKDKDEKPRPERHADPKQTSPEARAARKAKDMNGGGRVLSVSPDDKGHRVKVLKKGEVHEIHVPDEEADPNAQHPADKK